jgi:hypothetical protein
MELPVSCHELCHEPDPQSLPGVTGKRSAAYPQSVRHHLSAVVPRFSSHSNASEIICRDYHEIVGFQTSTQPSPGVPSIPGTTSIDRGVDAMCFEN